MDNATDVQKLFNRRLKRMEMTELQVMTFMDRNAKLMNDAGLVGL